MPTTIPQEVRAVLGEEGAAALARWVEETIRERTVPLAEYRQDMTEVKTRIGSLEEGQRELRRDVGALRREVNERFDRMSERFDQMYHRMLVQTRWTVGTIALFGTIVTILLAIAEFAA